MQFDVYIEKAQVFFDNLVERASDDELFAGGYLRGHFDLAVGYAQVAGDNPDAEALNEKVEASLVNAYHNGELNEDDKAHVVRVWEQVKALAE